jgi:hypothetical protein
VNPARRRGFLAALCIGLVGVSALGSTPAQAEEIRVEEVVLQVRDEQLVLDADFEFELGARLEEALNRGIPLYFQIDAELSRSRWYWFDEAVASRGRKLRLGYHALTGQYRLSSGNLHLSFATLEEARRTLSRVRGWVIGDASRVQGDRVYQLALRMRLDTSELPKPFQVSALANRDWKLASDWRRITWSPRQSVRELSREETP